MCMVQIIRSEVDGVVRGGGQGIVQFCGEEREILREKVRAVVAFLRSLFIIRHGTSL